MLFSPLRLFVLLAVFFTGALISQAQGNPAVPLRRPISPQQPMWLIHIDTWNYADPQKIIALVPADLRPFVVMNISLSISHNEETSQFQVAEYGYEIAKSWLRACAENQMWAMVQPSSGGFSHFSDFDLSVYEEFYRDFPNMIGFNYCEQFWGYDSTTDPLSPKWTDRINHFARLLPLTHKYGGYLVVSWCGNQWSPNINPIGMLKRVPAFAAASRQYAANYILCEKHTQQSYQYDMESLALGAWLSGYSGHYGMRYDDTGWTDTTGTHANFTMATQGAPFLEHVMLTGQTVFDGPELIWTQCFREISAGATTDGYTMRRWETFPQFDNVSVDLFRKVIDGTVRIPTRREVIDRTQVVVINDVNTGSADTIYSSPETLFEGLYRMDGDGNLRDNKTFFKKTGRYPTIPTVFQLADADAQSFPVKVNRSAYASRWPTIAAKVAEFDARFPSEYTGDIYAGRHENGWVVYNPYKTGQTASGVIPFKYNTAASMELTLAQYTAGVVKEYADRVTYYLSNYDNVLDTGLKTDVIVIRGASSRPTWSYADRGSHQASVLTDSWVDGVFTLTVRHNGPLDITVNCAGTATGRLTAYTPANIIAPARPSVFAGPRQYEAECFDYKSIGGITRGGNTGPIRNYTGQGYLQFGNGSGSAVRDVVTVPAAGRYLLRTRYSVTGADITSVDLYVNNARIGTPVFTRTPTLSDWAVLEQSVQLAAGANTVEFRSTGTRTTALYFDNIVAEPTAFAQGLIIQENEPGFVRVDGAVSTTRSGHTGEGYADTTDAAGTTVRWKVRYPEATTAAFTFRYASDTERIADLYLNGVNVASGVRFPATSAPETWRLVSVHAAIGAGTSEVRLQAVSASGLPDLDFLGVGGAEQTGQLSPAADTYARDGGSASTNFGTANQLVAKHDANLNSGFSRVSYLKFDVSGLGDAQNVRLKLVPFQVDGPATLSFERIADDTWSESTLNWNNRPTAPGTLAATHTGYVVGQQVAVDLTAAARAEAGGDGILSLRVVNDGWNFIGFHSRESATAAFRPVLEFTLPTVTRGAVRIAHLRFDEGSGTLAQDSTGHDWHGTLMGSPTWISGANARIDGSLQLSAGAHVSLPAALLAGLHDATFAFWVKPDALTDEACIFEFGDGTALRRLAFTPRTSAGSARFTLTVGDVTHAVEANSAPNFAPGQWTHVAVSLAGHTATLFLNGQPAATNPAFALLPADLGTISLAHLGTSATSDAPAFTGTIDDFILYSGALPADEIALLATPPAAPAGFTANATHARVALSWNAVPGATLYTLSRATSPDGPYTVLEAVVGTSYTDTTVLNGGTYHYRLSAGNGVADGPLAGPVSASPSPVALHLPLNAGSGTHLADASGRGWHATVTGSAAWQTGANARLGAALRFTGGHAALPSGVVAALNDCTVSFWVRIDSIATWARVFDFNNGNTTSSMYFVPRTSGNRVRFGLNGQLLEAPTEVQFTAGAWTHVAIVLSGSNATLYLNGSPVVSSATFTNKPSGLGATPFNYLGRSASTADATLSGALDEFVIYETPLSAADIAALASVPVAPLDFVAQSAAGSVALGWSALPGASGYTLQRATAALGPWSTVASLPGSLATYLDSSVTPGVVYHYRVGISSGVGGGSTSTTQVLEAVNSYTAWAAAAFGPEATPGQLAAIADPDGDGWSNLLEYTFGTDPLAPDGTDAAPTLTSTPNGDLVFEFLRAKGRPDLTLIMQTSTDLAAWIDSTLVPQSVADEGTHLRLRVTLPRGDAPRLFVRLRATAL